MNNREAMQALLDGKKVRNVRWLKSIFVHTNPDGTIYNQNYEAMEALFDLPYKWELYEEPKKKKKITFYEYVDNIGHGYLQWCANKEYVDGLEFAKLTGNTKEVEIDA